MALPILPDLYGKVEQKIDTFTFRNEGSIKIPKEKREIAYKQAVDIFIDSIDFNLYQNNKSAPPLQFYGYATLVFEDAISQSIPLIFPRQRLIDATNWEAFRQWNELAVFWEHWQFHRWNEIKILQIQGALEIPDIVDFSPQFGDTKFLELPLREVFVQVQSNCQFRIEYSQYQPISYTDPFGNVRNGKSDQTDGEKDGGLPSGGIQPKQNSPSNPFGGSRPSAGIPTIDNGFFVDDSKLDNVDPANDELNEPATPTSEGYFIRVSVSLCSAVLGINPPRVGILSYSLPAYQDSVINFVSQNPRGDDGCGNAGYFNTFFDIVSPTKGTTANSSVPTYGAVQGFVGFGLIQPPLFDGSPY